jgi:hypothetical protein
MSARAAAAADQSVRCHSVLGSTIVDELHVEQQVLPLPRRNHVHELVVLDGLDLGVDGDELVAQDLAQVFVVAQQLEGLAEASRQRIAALVGVRARPRAPPR